MASKLGKPAVASFIKLTVPAGKATPSPPVGPALGQKGVKSMDFCKQFNERTKDYKQGLPIPVKIHVKPDRTFTFVTTAPPASHLLKLAAGVEKGSSRNVDDIVGKVSLKQIYEIAKIKAGDPGFMGKDLEQVAKIIAGQTRSIGLQVVP